MDLGAHHRRTKVVWSFAADALPTALESHTEQADILRLVFDGSTQTTVDFLYSAAKLKKRPSIMVDLATGARAYVCDSGSRLDLAFGERVTITHQDGDGDVKIRGEKTDRLFSRDAMIFFGYGNVVLKAVDVDGTAAVAEVIQGGTIYDRMAVHVPKTRSGPGLESIEISGLGDILAAGVEFLVVRGGVGSAELEKCKVSFRERFGVKAPWLIAKIDTKRALDQVEALVEVVDGVMVSRRDLAIMVNPAQVPMITKEIIQRCNAAAKVVITASEMLASMRRNATPTRAEVSDIANTVIDGADAVVLSEEVTLGKHGNKALAMTHRIIDDIEVNEGVDRNWRKHGPAIHTDMDAISYNAYRTAQRMRAKAIVCITHEGNTALKLASYGVPIPIIAVTFSQSVASRLAIIRGVQPLVVDIDPNLDEILPIVTERLLLESWLVQGDRIVFVSITLSSLGREASNLFTVQTLAAKS